MEQPVTILPKEIPQGATSFEANGKTYRKASALSFKRFGWMERLQVEFSYGRSVQEMFKGEREAYELLNKQKFADAAVKMDNNMRGIASVADGKVHPAMKMCMLFWNYDGEDTRTMSDELMDQKLADMESEGVEAGFFFDQAAMNVPGFLAAYKLLSLPSSEPVPSPNGSSTESGKRTESQGQEPSE